MSSGYLWLAALGFVLLLGAVWMAVGLGVWIGALAARRAWDRATFAYWCWRWQRHADLADSMKEHPSGRR